MDAVPNPGTTGGAGTDFEFKVGAACLTLMLTKGAPLFLEACTLSAVHFQTKYLGWETDDLLLEAMTESGANRKAAIQVKLSFVLRARDEECVKTVRRAFADFRNAKLFDQNRDVVGLVAGNLSALLIRGLRSLLDCARASKSSEDLVYRLKIPGYLGKPTLKYYETIVAILQGSEGPKPTAEEIWRFLNRFNVVDLDLNDDRGFVETMLRSLLLSTCPKHDPLSSDATWNELRAIAAARTGSATSFTFAKLPEHLRHRHDKASGMPAGISRLLEDTRVVSEGIRTTIGRQTEIPRRELFGTLCQLIEENSLVFVIGEAGAGKSVLAKMAFSLMTHGALGIAFRAESLAGTHINEVLARFGLTLDGLRYQTAMHGRKILWIESLERLMEKDAEQRAAFLDLLREIEKDPTWKIIVTCRDYSAETVKSAFFGEAGLQSADLPVPELEDAELEEVIAISPDLQRPMSNAALRRLLRKPFLLDKAVLMTWGADEPLPQHERAFREKVWREVVRRSDEGLIIGLPRLRSDAFIEVALRRAKAMEPFVQAADLDRRALYGLVRDSLLSVPAPGDDRFAPAHDVYEDWALAVWLDSEFERGGRQLENLLLQIGTYPALRRGFRKWLTELLDVGSQSTDSLVINTIRNSSVKPHRRDDILVGALLSADANGFLVRNAVLLNSDAGQLLRQIIHLLRVACKAAIPRRLFGIEGAGDVFLPRGEGWNGAAELMEEADAQFGETDFPFVLGFMEDWVLQIHWGMPYPRGASSIAKLAMRWLPRIESWRCPIRDGRERLFKILVKIPLAAKPELSQMVTKAIGDDEDSRDYSDLVELIFGHLYSDAFCRDLPDLAFQVAEHELSLDQSLETVLRQNSRDEMNHGNEVFGLGSRFSVEDYPPSAYNGPYLRFLWNHPVRGSDFIIHFVNRACDAFAHPSNRRRGGRGPMRISIRLPNGALHEQLADGRLWELYRGAPQGPDTLKSALMALEYWLLDKGKRGDSDLPEILGQFLSKSNNIAVTAVVASVATAYPDRVGEVAMSVLTNRHLFQADLNRFASESMSFRLTGGLWPDLEKRSRDKERAASARLPHRQHNLENLAVALQGTAFRQRVWNLLDAYKSELPPENEQDEEARIWRLRLHQMDVRNFVQLGETPEGHRIFGAGPPPAELQEIIDEGRPQAAVWEAAAGLAVWGRSTFEGKPGPGVEPGDWRAKLAAAQKQLDTPRQVDDQISHSIVVSGPAYIASVCVRDHWTEMDEAEQKWCALLICDSVEANADTSDDFKRAAMFSTEAARPSAFILSALFEKHLPPELSRRLLPALAKAVTHAVSEVVKFAVQGIASFLWQSDRPLALTCIHALILDATEQHRFSAEQRGQIFAPRSDGEEFERALQTRLRSFIEARNSGNDAAILQLDLTDWPGRQVAPHLFAILGAQPTDPLAFEFLKRSAAVLAARWIKDEERKWSRDNDPNGEAELDQAVEHQFVDALTHFLLLLSLSQAAVIAGPLFALVPGFPNKVAEFVKCLVTRQGEQAPPATLWSIWQKFADDFAGSSLPALVDDKRSDSAKLLRELFLGSNWGEMRDWPPLRGEAHRIRALFDRLPASREGLEAFAYFLSTIGYPLLPEALLGVVAKIPTVKAKALFSESAVFYFENILTHFVYCGNRAIRVDLQLREGVLAILDALIAEGSSVAYRLRDDFLTPASK